MEHPRVEHFFLTRFFLGILTRSQGKQSEVVIVVVIGVIVVVVEKDLCLLSIISTILVSSDFFAIPFLIIFK